MIFGPLTHPPIAKIPLDILQYLCFFTASFPLGPSLEPHMVRQQVPVCYLTGAVLVLNLLIFLLLPHTVHCDSPLLIEGIQQYKQENYGEAARILENARKEDPRSSTAAFFLGLTYKQLMDYPKALPHLRDAVTLEPRIKEALVELIEVLYQLYDEEKAREAMRWIEVAEREDIYPAKAVFLKGLILAKEGKDQQAREAFEKAKSLDKTLAQSADVQIALTHLNEKEFKKAKERLHSAILQDPTTDLASFARQYQDMVDTRIDAEKPVRVTFSSFGQYDTNVVLKPTEGALAPGITNKDSLVFLSALRFDYTPVFEGPFLFNAQYAVSGNWHQHFSTSNDAVSNGVYVAPGYNLGTSAINLALRYNQALVRNTSYHQYVDVFSVGPLYRTLMGENRILEFFAGYSHSEYADPPLIPQEDRDSDRFNSYVNWVWLFKKDAFFNLKYEYSNEDTQGANWANQGHSISFAFTLPLVHKLSLQLSGEAFLQRFQNVHSEFNKKRDDDIYTVTGGFSYQLIRDLNLILQYTYNRANSNIGIYDYERSIYALGFEYRF
jgi:Tfp pilus assembly protein PilF